MKTVDLSPLVINDKEYSDLVTAVSDNYKCEWDDDVHESYGLYVKQMQENKEQLHTIRCKAESLIKELESLDIDEMLRNADSVCEEADDIC